MLPQVQKFIDIRDRIHRLQEAYPEIFEQYQVMIEEYNTAQEAADQAVRALGVSCGPWEAFQEQKTYNADKLYEELGHEQFLSIGGSIKTVRKYEVDKARVEASIASGAIPKDIVDSFRKVTVKYHKPEKVVLP
jgi:hypothetical protein